MCKTHRNTHKFTQTTDTQTKAHKNTDKRTKAHKTQINVQNTQKHVLIHTNKLTQKQKHKTAQINL